jgi:hypothetical protein
LAFLEGPPIESTQAFILDNIERDVPQWVASSVGEVVGWRDLTPNETPIYAHDRVLGMGLLPQFRARRIGANLIRPVLARAEALDFTEWN